MIQFPPFNANNPPGGKVSSDPLSFSPTILSKVNFTITMGCVLLWFPFLMELNLDVGQSFEADGYIGPWPRALLQTCVLDCARGVCAKVRGLPLTVVGICSPMGVATLLMRSFKN